MNKENTCPNCGNSVNSEAVFCDKCGNKLVNGDNVVAGNEISQSSKESLQKKEKFEEKDYVKVFGLTALVLSIIIIVIIVGVSPRTNRNDNESLTEEEQTIASQTNLEINGINDEEETSLTAGGETVSAGSFHSLGVKIDGTVVATEITPSGYDLGQCNVSDWTDIVAVSASFYYSLGLRSDETVVATGDNRVGQCDVSGWTDIVAVSAGNDHSLGLRSDGTVLATGDNEDGACDVSDWTDIVSISAASTHSLGLKSDGTVVATGDNEGGACDVSDWTDIVAVSAGPYYSLGLRSDGTVVAAGDPVGGQCNISDWTNIVAVSAGSSHSLGLRSDGTVVAAGWPLSQCNVSSWTNIVAISAGPSHSLGLKSDGTVVATESSFLSGDYGQCDVSDWTDIVAVPGKLINDKNEASNSENKRFSDLPNEYDFSSGAGAWSTKIILHEDGTFEGYFYDKDAISSDEIKYPNGTLYYSTFSGKFNNLEKVDETTYTIQVDYFYEDNDLDKLYYEEGVEYIQSNAYGVSGAKEFTVFLPGTKKSQIDEECLSLPAKDIFESGVIPDEYVFLCNLKDQAIFIGHFD